jgi:hypothetical protein
VAIFARAMALTQTLGGVPVISCKSGKDRTAMAVTLEEGRVLKETCGISPQQVIAFYFVRPVVSLIQKNRLKLICKLFKRNINNFLLKFRNPRKKII